jgi:TPR repeat protein
MRVRLIAILAVSPLLLWSAASNADFEQGQEAYSSGDYETAIAAWQPLAEAGNADAQFGMGLLYANGFGVSMNDDQALKWYGLAAGQDHAEAQTNLGVMYANGWGVPQSDEEAFKWYRLAAEQGVMAAQMGVAKMYASDFGPEKNFVQAHKWFNIASELGDYNAASKRDDLSARMEAEQVAEATDLAATWLERYRTLQANQ